MESALKRVEENSDLNAFIALYEEHALNRAAAVDDKVGKGLAGRLAGMVVGIKDNIAIREKPTTCASRMLKDYISPYDATVIQRLEKEDAIILGKTNMDEFGMGSSSEYSYCGPVRNPFQKDRTAGGSSGGSACAVAAGLVMTALGSDTGGSVRQPAGFCGILGLRPTYGRISRYGLIAFASSLDQIGCFSVSPMDCALLMEVIAGRDERDSTTLLQAVPEYSRLLDQPLGGLRIGVPQYGEGIEISIEVRQALEKLQDFLTETGFEIIRVSMPHIEYAIPAYYITANAEASSNLSRYDGVDFGYRDRGHTGIRKMIFQSRQEGLGSEVKRRIMLGTFALSRGYYDAYYQRAQKVRSLIRGEMKKCLDMCDLLLTPISPTTAFSLGEKTDDPLSMYYSDLFTVSAALAGFPALSFPIGRDSERLPIGAQLTAKPLQEDLLLQTVHHWRTFNGI